MKRFALLFVLALIIALLFADGRGADSINVDDGDNLDIDCDTKGSNTITTDGGDSFNGSNC
jgi:hypothetical protein